MAMSFNTIPTTLRSPGVYVEFDNSMAMQGATLLQYQVLVAGQKLSTGTAEAGKGYYITSKEDATKLFGAGSQLAHMAAAFLANNSFTSMKCIALVDDSAGEKAQATITITGTVVTAAPVILYIGGRAIRCAAASGTTAAALATALAAAVNAEPDLPVSALAASSALTLTAKNAGEEGNTLDLRLAYYGETMPTGVSFAITAFAGGAGNPDATELIAAIGDDWYHIIVWPWLDRANLRLLEDELDQRWGPMRHSDGMAFASKRGTYSELVTWGKGEEQGNYEHICIMECCKTPDSPWERAARVAAIAAYYGNIDPARPFQTLKLTGSLSPASADRLTLEERNLLLFAGIATSYSDAGGDVRVERLITNYRVSANGAADSSFLDVNTQLTLSYLRYDFRARILRKYPRHKLAGDDMAQLAAAGQAIMTPKIGKAEAIAAYQDWMNLGLVEDMEAFKAGLLCERNATDPNRLDWKLTPDLVNQFRVGAVQIQFAL